MADSRSRSIISSRDGIAILEFSLALPFLLMLMLATVEVTRYILITQKVEKASMTIADVTAQGSTITSAQLDNILTAARQIMRPFEFGSSGYIIVSSISQNGDYSMSNPPRINWQYSSSGENGSWTQASQVGSPGLAATLPTGLTLFDRDNLIITEVFYNFQPIVLSPLGMNATSMIYRTGLYKPRLGALTTLGALRFWELGGWRML